MAGRRVLMDTIQRLTPLCWCGEAMTELGIGKFPPVLRATAKLFPNDMVWTGEEHGHKAYTYDSARWVKSNHL